MRTFKDNAGRAWTITVHVTAVKRCRTLLDLDLLKLIDDGFKGLGELLADVVRLVDVIYVLCEADKAGVDDEDFGREMFGDPLEAAERAFLEALTDFFQDPRIRSGIQKVIETGRKVADRLIDDMNERLDGVDVDSLASRLIASSGTSPGSSGSTQAPSPSAS